MEIRGQLLPGLLGRGVEQTTARIALQNSKKKTAYNCNLPALNNVMLIYCKETVLNGHTFHLH